MEYEQQGDIFAAIDQCDLARIPELVDNDPGILTLRQDGVSVIGYAHNRLTSVDVPQDYIRRRETFVTLVSACAGLAERGLLPQGMDSELGPFLITAAESNDAKLAHELLKAGADPNTANPETGFTPLFHAILNNTLSLVRVLVNYGADPESPCGHHPNALSMSLGSNNRIFWYLLFKHALNLYDPDLIETFASGSLNGAEERKAIAKLGIPEASIFQLCQMMIRYGAASSAAGTVLGYIDTAIFTPESPEGTRLLEQLVSVIADTEMFEGSGFPYHAYKALKLLAKFGFKVAELPSVIVDRLLFHIIECDQEGIACKLVTLGLVPSMEFDPNANKPLRCAVLDRAIAMRMPDLILEIFLLPSVPGELPVFVIGQLLDTGDDRMLAEIGSQLSLPAATQIRLLSIAVNNRSPRCLAALVQTCCSSAAELQVIQPTEQNYAGFCLFQALALQDHENPDLPERFDCARILFLGLAPLAPRLRRLCDFILCERGSAGDIHAVFFLCSHGFAPLLLLDRFRTAWASDESSEQDKVRLADAVICACEGITVFIERVLDWNLQQYARNAIQTLAPGMETLQVRELVGTLFTTDPADIEAWPAPTPDPRLILLLCEIGDREAAGYPANVLKAIRKALDSIIKLLRRHTEPPTLVDLAMAQVTEDPENLNYEEVRRILTLVTDITVADDLLNSTGNNFLLLQLMVLQSMRNDPELMPYFFTADEDSGSSDSVSEDLDSDPSQDEST